jgi:ribonuclease R
MAKSPFPSKQQIVDFVRDTPGRVGKREIARAFKLDVDQKRLLKSVLKEMKSEGMLDAGRRKQVSDPNTLPNVCIIEISGVDLDGEVLAKPAKWEGNIDPPTIYMSPVRTKTGALGIGDRALARLKPVDDGYEAEVIRPIAAAPSDVLGIVVQVEGERRIQPIEKRNRNDYVIERSSIEADIGDLVRAETIGRNRIGLKRAKIVERIAEAEGPRAISLISVHQHGIPVSFPDAARKLAEAATAAPMGKRDDLRSVPLVTIDGEDARDFDDAVFAEPDDDPKNADGHKIIVAIADVGWYVRPGDDLDKSAFERGNSVYFPDRVVPMLPEELSNGWCSLRPNEDRPCLVAHLRIDNAGNLLSKRFKRAMMRSHARLTYNQVQAAYDGNPDPMTAPLMDEVITPLYDAYAVLLAAREARGALELDLPERRVILDENGSIARVEPRERLDSHKLIEEFMVLANVAAAEFLEEKSRPCMYRVHDEPSLTKVEALSEVLQSLGIRFDKGQTLSPKRFNDILKRAADKPYSQMMNDVILRSQSQAKYDPNNIGHFGLALRRYCHFTSPIRRYSDLLVHRALIRGMTPSAGALPEEHGDFVKIGEHLYVTERRAQVAERDAMDRFTADYLKDRVGAQFGARISGVSRFGLFVNIDDIGADGLVPIRSLPDDYYVHDENRHVLTGRSNKLEFRLGDRVDVNLVEATPVTGGLVFEIAGYSQPETPKAKTQKSGGGKPRKFGKKVKGKSRAARRAKRKQAEKRQ